MTAEELALVAPEDQPREAVELARLLDIANARNAGRQFYRLFPEDGFYSRYNYPRQIEFFALGSSKPYRCFMGANGTGKSVAGGYETVCHLTGIYPSWWTGKRFTRPITAWAAGVDFKTVRESMQPTLIGKRGEEGLSDGAVNLALIPRDLIVETKYRTHPADTLDFIVVRHVSGGTSRLVVKSYEEGRESFQAANVDWIWLDEEPPWDIYSECIARFRGETSFGQLVLTFTPLLGISEVICMFVPQFMENFNEREYEESGRAFVNCTLDDVPHISAEDKLKKIANTLPHEREARTRGMPSIGEGMVFPVAEDSFLIDPIPGGVPKHFPRLYGLDPGRRTTAAVWGAHDTDSDIIYLYSEHYLKEQLPPVHAVAIRARGHWIPGIIDPASKKRIEDKDESLLDYYTDAKFGLGLRLRPYQHKKGPEGQTSVAVGILEVLQRLTTGRLKIYRTMPHWLREFRRYARDKHGKIIKHDDHLMDATRYLVMGIGNAMLPHEPSLPSVTEETFGLYGGGRA